MSQFLRVVIYYGSFLVFPFVAAVLIYRRRLKKVWFVLWLLAALLFIWMRWVETRSIIVRHTDIDLETQMEEPVEIALISDMHLGVYKHAPFMRRVVRRLNRLAPDMVVIAGDLTYEPHAGTLEHLMSPFADIEAPTYAVLGNHDVGIPGPPLRDALGEALEFVGVEFLNNEVVTFDDFYLVGLGSFLNHEDDISLLQQFTEEDTVIVLAHNPDTTLRYQDEVADLTLAGHTHCGQIRIPGLAQRIIPVQGDFDKGHTHEEFTQLYITCGLGEVGLPLRLFNKTVIDVLAVQ